MKAGSEPIGRRIIAAETDTRHTPPAQLQQARWQQELARAVRDPVELLTLLDLTPQQIGPGETAASLRAAAEGFELRVPLGFVRRMRRGDPEDPLLRQVLPVGAERLPVAGYVADPLGEQAVRATAGLLHKYHGRALLITTGACAVHCRYCFRRHYDYAADLDDGSAARWSAALDHVASDSSIEEIILSGGDPLSLGNARLAQLLQRLQNIDHVKRIRMHTRTPIVLPERIDAGLLAVLQPLRERLVVVVHANHPAELDEATQTALRELSAHCAALLNQSVLLAGINDDSGVLASLSTRLFESGVLPYYLHQLDAVAGAAHFAVSDAQALEIHAALAALLPGYLLPRLVREQAGATEKTPLR
jgi:EF-P beta-lysylation protein EpmB